MADAHGLGEAAARRLDELGHRLRVALQPGVQGTDLGHQIPGEPFAGPLDLPPNMLTVLFALGRLSGWNAHWREMITDPATKIGRPRPVYTSPTARDYAQITDR